MNVHAAAKATLQRAEAAATKAWTSWAREAFSGGASQARRFSKVRPVQGALQSSAGAQRSSAANSFETCSIMQALTSRERIGSISAGKTSVAVMRRPLRLFRSGKRWKGFFHVS